MKAALDLPGVRLRAADLITLRTHALRNSSQIKQFAALPGGHATRSKGQGIEIADIREYIPGDDIRHLDRSSTARTGRLHVKQFQAERDSIRIMVVDMRSSMLWGVKRALLSIVAAEASVLDAWPLVDRGGRIGAMAITDQDVRVVPPRARVRAMLDVIGGLVEAHEDALNAVQAHRDELSTLDKLLHRLDRIAPSGAEIVIASSFDAQGEGLSDVLDGLAQRRKIKLLLISATDSIPPGRYPVTLADGRRIRLAVGAEKQTGTFEKIAGRRPVVIDAGSSVDQLAETLADQRNELMP